MTDIQQARSMEERRLERALQELDSQHALRVSRIEAEMSRRGLQHSDARRQAIFEARLERLNKAVLQRMAIRKEIVRNCPELGSAIELNSLRQSIEADVSALRLECQKASVIVPPEVFAELRARAHDGLAAIQRETPMEIPVKPKLPGFSLSVSSSSPAKANGATPMPISERPARSPLSDPVTDIRPEGPGAVLRKVDEAIDDLAGRNGELAQALRGLAAAIQGLSALGDERSVYLEQVQYLAEQAARVAVLRRVSVVKGILVALHAGLDGRPSVERLLHAANSLLATHFGI